MYPNKLSRSFPSPNANRFALTTPHVPQVDVKQRPRSEFTTFTRAHLKPTPFGRLLEKNEQRTDNTCRSQKTEPNDNRNSNSDSNRALIVVTFFAAFHVPVPPVSLYVLCYTNQPTTALELHTAQHLKLVLPPFSYRPHTQKSICCTIHCKLNAKSTGFGRMQRAGLSRGGEKKMYLWKMVSNFYTLPFYAGKRENLAKHAEQCHHTTAKQKNDTPCATEVD